ncbi:MAG: hypothetical protein MUE54_04740, partial [Anaerolineae bacterium]|nr:hypothetical protein [Anaerolineae bacterium]
LTPLVDENGNFVQVNVWNQGVTAYLQSWSGALPSVTDGTNTNFEYMTIGQDIASIDGRYRLPDSNTWNDVTVTLSFDGILGGTTQRVINKAEGNNALAVIDIPAGAIFQTYTYIVTGDGRVSAVEGNEYIWTEDGLTWQFVPAIDGNYNVGLLVTAFGGITGFISETVTVNNNNIPVELRADTRPDIGVTIPRLEQWTPLALNDAFAVNPDFGNIAVFQTSDPENSNLFALMFSFPTSVLEEAVETAAMYNVFTVVGETRPIVVDGRDALEFDYVRQTGDISRSGRAYVVLQEYAPGETFGVVLASESIDGEGDFEAFYPTLRDYAKFFSALDYEASKVPLWRVERMTGEELYYVPTAWQRIDDPSLEENVAPSYGMWTRYVPADATANAPFLAMTRYRLVSGVESGVNVLSNIITGQALVGADSFEVLQNRTYNGRYHTWDATMYRAVRDGLPYIGRAYATTVYGTTYALWAEVPDDDNTDSVYTNFIETVIDTYTINIEPPAEPEPEATPES